ncbi:MAG: metalloregulator ArsR/SmtB family transcription factor [Pseudomonadota bacterium]
MEQENSARSTLPCNENLLKQEFSVSILEREAAIFKALGHPMRLALVHALAEGPRCVCELHSVVQAVSKKDLSTVSRHLGTLQQAGVISSERRGTHIYYALTLSCLGTFVRCTGSSLQQVAIGDEPCL